MIFTNHIPLCSTTACDDCFKVCLTSHNILFRRKKKCVERGFNQRAGCMQAIVSINQTLDTPSA